MNIDLSALYGIKKSQNDAINDFKDEEKDENAPKTLKTNKIGHMIKPARVSLNQERESLKKAISDELIEITKGVQRGDNIYTLFLAAIEIIGKITDDKVVAEQIMKDTKAIYPIIGETQAAEVLAAELRERLACIERAKASGTGDNLERLMRAERVIKEKLQALETIAK